MVGTVWQVHFADEQEPQYLAADSLLDALLFAEKWRGLHPTRADGSARGAVVRVNIALDLITLEPAETP
jgi:hypothetical protein